MDVISSLSNAITIASRLREISKNISEAEFKNLLADLSLELADAKIEMVSLKEEIATLKQKVFDLDRAKPENKQNKKLEFGCYKFEGEEGLFCTACYDLKGIKCQTNRLSTKFRSCPVCKATIGA